MERKIYNDLLRWKKDAYKPLLLYGSKQIGKTYSVIDFGRRCYKNIVYFNTTNNKDLFDFAVDEVEPAGWKMDAITYDLHHDEIMNQGNVLTEYEEKFSSKGNPIYKYIISRCK